MKNKIKKILEKVVGEIAPDFDTAKIDVTLPKDTQFGDYTTNVSMMLSGMLQDSPLSIAEKIKESLSKEIGKIEEIEKMEVVTPGYINFYLSKKYFANVIKNVLEKGDDWGETEILKDKKYIFEHSSPNLFKPFHIGHLVNNSIGESLSRIIKKSGAEVKTLSFPSDASPGIAKTVWAIKKKEWENEMTVEKIGEAYVIGTKEYKENEEAKKEIDEINKKIYLGEDFDGRKIYETGYNLSLEYFKNITARLGSKFDGLVFESEAEIEGKRIVKEYVPEIFRESKGAIIFPGSEYGLFDNVFINSQGFGTYLAKDIGLLNIKFDKFEFDKSITITDIEQRENFQLVKKSAGLINKDWEGKSEYIQHGRLSFAEGKVSSRYGNVPLAEDLIEKTKERIFKKIEDRDFSEKERDAMAEKISIGALKYSIVSSSAGKNMVFDFERSIAFEGDSGPYLQYSYVRANSILNKLEKYNIEDFLEIGERKGDTPTIEKMIARFPAVIARALEEYSPHVIANYLHSLASEFNSFYAHTKIADETNEDYKNNVALTEAVKITLQNGLYLLGIETVEKM